MKNIYAPIAMCMLFMSLVFTSCSSDTGYYEYDYTQQFLGIYDVEESCNSADYTYTISITRGDYDNEVYISNFAGYDRTVIGEVFENEIRVQDRVSGIEYTGSGTLLNNGNLRMEYSVQGTNSYDECVMYGFYR